MKASKSLEEAIARIKTIEKELLRLSELMLASNNGNLFPVDLVAVGAMKRTASNTEGFIKLIETQNMTCARSLLRVQLDTAMRFSAIWLVESPHDFANEIINGKHIRNIKDKSGNKMTDLYLAETLSKEYSWVKPVYDNLSGYIHFSAKHLFSAIEKVDAKTKTLSIVIGKEDQKYTKKSWIETIDCFIESVLIFFHYLNGWIASKNQKK